MKYASPELVVIGRAETVVMGVKGLPTDNATSIDTQAMTGFALGLDD